MKLDILNSKELKQVRRILEDSFGVTERLPYAFFLSEKGDIYISNDSIKSIDTKKLNIHTVGIYFGEMRDNKIRLSIEGSQIVGKIASKNVLDVDEVVARKWMKGEDIPSTEFDGWVIVKSGNDFLGCGKYKEGKILNHVPKERRVHE